MTRRETVRFRPHQAIMLAAVLGFIGSLPLAATRWYLLPILLIPLLVIGWTVRAGTDADIDGLRLRALIGQRRIPWSQIAELGTDRQGRALALLRDGQRASLPAVRGADLPRLIAASGQQLGDPTGPAQDEPAQDEPAQARSVQDGVGQ